MHTQKNLIPSLNGMRAVSILLVILSHWTRTPNMPDSLKNGLSFLFNGTMGVRMFFVISGFIITLLLLREIKSTGRIDFKAFYIRRSLRIFPPFYFFILVLVLLKAYSLIQLDFANIFCALLYVENFRFARPTWILAHSWSLSVEEQFYLVWPALALFVTKYKLDKKILVLMLLLGSGMRCVYYKYPEHANFVLAPFFMYFDFIFIGCYAAYYYFYHEDVLKNMVSKINGYYLTGAILIAWYFSRMEYDPVYDWFFIPSTGTVVAIVATMCLIYFIYNKDSFTGKILNAPFVDFLGRLSYSLYIWQQLFLGSNAALSPRIAWIALFPQNMGLVILATIGSYYFVERPFLKIKDRFTAKHLAASSELKT